jgi:hypothetical protein
VSGERPEERIVRERELRYQAGQLFYSLLGINEIYGGADKSNHPHQTIILTYHREESCVEFTSQNARRELTHERLEQSRNSMWVPVLIRSE